MKRALILDLDNTIYPVSQIADNLFKKLFDLIDREETSVNYADLEKAKDELTRRNFQLVADKYHFSPHLKTKGIQLLKDMTYDLPMQPFEQYQHIKSSRHDKFLVTTGFSKLQWSKIKMLGIEADFLEIHIVDPETSQQTKKDVFASIMQRHNYNTNEILVIGDDPESEIKAANELGIETFLFDPAGKHPENAATYKDTDLKGFLNFI
ncbi:MAG: dUMP phosphatase [Mucilaginibacter sp.]|jgi:putative hydrolase of the HAD superfamily|nr:dUMP phosphatase [Mucilaginibacter sp.]